MRIALAGAHEVGKSTLASELAEALPDHRVIEEPYYQLEGEGYPFAFPPTIEDYEAQLERSLRCIREDQGNVIFDRSPADFFGYILTHTDEGHTELAHWLAMIRATISTLDLLVFVPVESPDRINPAREAARLRRRVNAHLRAGLLGNEWEFGESVLEVGGTPAERTRQVLYRMAALRANTVQGPNIALQRMRGRS